MRSRSFPAILFASAILAVVCQAGVYAGTNAGVMTGKRKASAKDKKAGKGLVIKVTPAGPTKRDIDAARALVAADKNVARELAGSKFREVDFQFVSSNGSTGPERFRQTIYSYSRGLALNVEGDLAGREPITAYWSNAVPGVGEAEMAAAYELVRRSPEYSSIKPGRLELYDPMPPTTIVNGERLVNVGVRDNSVGSNVIVGVSFKDEKIVQYENSAPPTSAARQDSCELPSAGQMPSGPGFPGSANVTVKDTNDNTLWEMLVIRPSGSSGAQFERSGLEIRDVRYKGKSVMKRGHVPILNVKYVSDCGPFRDWLYGEGWFDAPEEGSLSPAEGFRVLAPGKIATTIVESRNDTGNFQGVAIYTQDVGNGPEMVMVTEMNAGWYRYSMEWRFAQDGSIRPRFGYGSIANSCVCILRTHHAYWRFDMDVVQPANNIFVMDRSRKYQRQLTTESLLFRDLARGRSLLIRNPGGDEAYQIVPGLDDGSAADAAGRLADAFAGGDMWLTRFHGSPSEPEEISDPDGPVPEAANISAWLSGESLVEQDVVVWYATHTTRSNDASRPDSPGVLTGQHVAGPTLRPVQW